MTMLYALTRDDGNTSITYVMPKDVIVDGKTLPVTLVNAAMKYLNATDDDGNVLIFPLPSDDIRDIEADSVAGAVLTFYDIEKIMNDLPDTYVAREKITVADIPSSRVFRDAWTVSGKSVTVDLDKAKDVTRNRLREARKPMLADLDVAYQRADEAGDVERKKAIAKEKQRLRDITKDPRIEAATTPEALMAITP
jgi:hypothetical protein